MRVLLVDDHVAFRQPLAFVLDREPDLEVVGQAGSLAEARRVLAGSGGVDVALLDLGLPDGDGVDLIRVLRAADPRGKAVVLTGSGEAADAGRAAEAGAAGVLDKSCTVADIISALRRLGAGEEMMSPAEAVALLRLAGERRERDRAARAAFGRLTAREREVLRALADGLSDREIGDRLRFSTETVRAHVANLLATLGVDSRLRAVAFAMRHRLVGVHEEADEAGGEGRA